MGENKDGKDEKILLESVLEQLTHERPKPINEPPSIRATSVQPEPKASASGTQSRNDQVINNIRKEEK